MITRELISDILCLKLSRNEIITRYSHTPHLDILLKCWEITFNYYALVNMNATDYTLAKDVLEVVNTSENYITALRSNAVKDSLDIVLMLEAIIINCFHHESILHSQPSTPCYSFSQLGNDDIRETLIQYLREISNNTSTELLLKSLFQQTVETLSQELADNASQLCSLAREVLSSLVPISTHSVTKVQQKTLTKVTCTMNAPFKFSGNVMSVAKRISITSDGVIDFIS